MQGKMLTYTVKERLKGEDVTEKSIAFGCLEYTPEQFYAPTAGGSGPANVTPIDINARKSDARGYMGRLRAKLEEYYGNADSNDFIEIRFEKGSYNPIITTRFVEIDAADRRKMHEANEARTLRTATGFDKAISLYKEILDRSPEHPVILGRLAELHTLRVMHSVVPALPDLDLAFDYAQRALAKSRKVWEAYAALGGVFTCRDWDAAKASAAFEVALDLVGIRVKSVPWYRAFLMARGHNHELVEELEGVMSDLADIAFGVRRSLGNALMFSGDLAQAEHHLRAVTPHHLAHFYLSVVYEARGEYEKALDEIRVAQSRPDSEYVVPGFLVMMLAKAGKHDEASAEMRNLESASHYTTHFQFAVAHLGLGDVDRALGYLEASADAGEYFVLFLPMWPMFRDLRTHPRFQAIVKRMNLFGS